MMNRRAFLRAGGLLGVGMGVCSLVQAESVLSSRQSSGPDRSLRFFNLHTGEKWSSTYWADGEYLTDALGEINHLLRDFRRNEVADIDPQLIDQVFLLQQRLDSQGTIEIISGYRSPETNRQLSNGSAGVAKRSLHMQGRALDLRFTDRKLADVRQSALGLQLGGVGYYPGSNFVHVDTGRVRQWRG